MPSMTNCLWMMSGMMCHGAAHGVSRGGHKKTGDMSAVKVFVNVIFIRTLDVQMREFEVEKKVNHKIILKLFAVEEELDAGHNALEMELVPYGSLYAILNEVMEGVVKELAENNLFLERFGSLTVDGGMRTVERM
nr:serine/threonine-protein kinase TBK1-like protein [Danio rerio]